MEMPDDPLQLVEKDPQQISLESLAADDPRDILRLSSKEQLVLQLYDNVKNLKLEVSLLEARRVPPGSQPPGQDIDDQIQLAQRQLLEARVAYSLRMRVEENVMEANPILKAVHANENATIPQRLLLPLLNRRDILSLVNENMSSKVASTYASLSNAEVENMNIAKRNQELVQELMELTREARSQQDHIEDGELKERLETLRRNNQSRRARRRILKDVIGSVIVGSGVDWARNEELCGLVMDEE